MKNIKCISFQIWRCTILLVILTGLFGCRKVLEESFPQQLQNVLDKELRDQNLIGVTAAVIVPGEDIWQGASGYSDKVNLTAMKPDMLLGIGSITKTFTAALVLKLAEEQKLTLEDRVDSWLGIFPNINGFITIRQLLNHTSGIYDFTEHPNYISGMRNDLNKFWSPQEVLQNFVASPNFAPGTSFQYSNTNYLLLGMIIKKTTAEALSALYRKSFFEPLGLDSMFLECEETARGEVAHDWVDIDGDGVLDDTHPYPKTAFYSSVWSAGALFSRAVDLAKWLQALFQGSVLSQNSLNEMLDFSLQSNNLYGLGIHKTFYLGKELWGHDGGILGYHSLAVYEPSAKISISILLNQNIDATPNAIEKIMVSLLGKALNRLNQK